MRRYASGGRRAGMIGLLWLSVAAQSCTATSGPAVPTHSDPRPTAQQQKLLIIGQDLGAIRGYMASDCCPRPDALTAYVDFYDILKDDDFGGLGMNTKGQDSGFEFDWGAGPVNAYRTATEFGVDGLAIGLSLTENEHPGKLRRLVDGEFDPQIRQLARFSAKVKGPVYLRIGYEFDGAWNEGYQNAADYKAAFKRIVDVLRQEQADNVETVWQAGASTTDDIIDGGHEDITRWYPGDGFVDWMGLSWFMNPHETVQVSSSYSPKTPLELTEEVLAFARQRGKPVMIAEASPQAMDLLEGFTASHASIWDGPPGENRIDMSDDEIWDHWFAPTFELLENNRDVIHAFAYINADWDSQPMWGPPYNSGFWGDSRLEVNDRIAARFSDAVADWKAPR